MTFRPWKEEDFSDILRICNEIIEKGGAFQRDVPFTEEDLGIQLAGELLTEALIIEGKVAGFYSLRANGSGHCAHVANGTYGLYEKYRGRGLGLALVERSLDRARNLGFRTMQYNSVVATNERAQRTYEAAGFQRIGVIPEGYFQGGRYLDVVVFHKFL